MFLPHVKSRWHARSARVEDEPEKALSKARESFTRPGSVADAVGVGDTRVFRGTGQGTGQ